MADIKIVDLNAGVALGANDAVILIQGNETLKISGQDIATGVKTIANLADKEYVDAIAAGANGDAIAQLRAELETKLTSSYFGLYFWTELDKVYTSHIKEGSNLYYTEGRVDANFGTKTTDALVEGSTNLYHTTARARASVFDNDGKLTLPAGGDIVDSNGNSVLGGGIGEYLELDGGSASTVYTAEIEINGGGA